MNDSPLVLASLSPRREFILRMLGFSFRLTQPNFEEVYDAKMPSEKVPEFLAIGKALSIQEAKPEELILCSDTLVLLQENILGKPKSHEEAFSMLSALNGHTHQVITGVALARDGKILGSGSTVTQVTFANIPENTLLAYALSEEPMDKAGSYAIQGHGAKLVEKIEGCFYNVMGLPVQLTLNLLKPWIQPAN